jgi:type I site-specific restriction endonuclease
MESTNQQSDGAKSDREQLLDWGNAAVLQAKVEKVRAHLREWTAAAVEVPEPHQDLETTILIAETLLDLSVPGQDDPDELQQRLDIASNTLRMLKREMNTARKSLRRKAEKWARLASRADRVLPPENLNERMTEQEAERWNEATPKAREEARRRYRLLNQLAGCESTEELQTTVDEYKADHPDQSLSVASYYRWRGRLKTDGYPGLLPHH